MSWRGVAEAVEDLDRAGLLGHEDPPSGANLTAVGASRPLNAVVSWKPGSNPFEPVRNVWSLPQRSSGRSWRRP